MKSTIPRPAALLLDYIAHWESGGNYLAYYAHAKNQNSLPPTVGAVQAWQRTLKVSSATGRYQLMQKTLAGLCKTYGIPSSEPFTPDLQDELAFYLLVGRGYDHWIAGSLTDAGFADNLSQEWASLPYKTNKSYYDGDGLNHSLTSRVDFMENIVRAKKAIVTAPAVAKAIPTPAKKETPMVAPSSDNFFKQAIATAENFAAQIESSIKVIESPNNNVTISGVGSTGTGVFASIGEAQTCISDIMSLVENVKGKNLVGAEHDVIDFLKNLFAILSNFGIGIPGLTLINTVLADLDPVQAKA